MRCVCVVTALLVGLPALAAERRPNIVLILADDLGYGDVGCYGCTDIHTPAIDRLAQQGVRCMQFYANAPECSPTRTALLTGRYQQRVGGLECAIGIGNVGRYDDAIRLCAQHQLGLPPAQSSLVHALKRSGYEAAIIGKWHLGYEPHFLPLKHGFDRWFGVIGGSADYYFHTEPGGMPALYLNDHPNPRQGYLTDLITEEAVRFIRSEHDKPFFLYVPYTAPHTPYEAPGHKPDHPVSPEDWNRGDRSTYARMVEYLDTGVGRITNALAARGFDRNTVVIFASDNGANATGSNRPLSGRKSSLYEGGIRVPCVIRWPGRLPESSVSEQVTIGMDLTASIVRIAGASPPADRPFDGVDILKWLEEKRPPTPRTLFWRARRGDRTWRAVREGDMKYLARQESDRTQEFLFDLAGDPAEKQNLLQRRPLDVQHLKSLLADWEREVKPTR